MPSFLRRPTLWVLLPVAAVLAAVLLLGGGLRNAHAGPPLGPDCVDIGGGEVLCISLDPETDTNTVGDDHTVTATLSLPLDDLVPVDLSDIPIAIVVFDGPNAGESIIANTDVAGQVSLTYPGDGGPGTDTIGAIACLPFDGQADLTSALGVQPVPVDPCGFLEDFIGFCPADPAQCLFDLTEGECTAPDELICDVAHKTWEEPTPTPTPTPTPPPTATPTPTPTVLAAVQSPTPTPTPVVLAAAALPRTGGEPSDAGSGALPLGLAGRLAAIAGAMAMMGAGGVWLAYGRRRVR